MTKTNSIATIGTLALLVLFYPLWIEGAESGQTGHIKQTLDASALPQAGKVAVSAKADAAIHAGVPAEDVEVIVARALGRNADAETINRFLDAGITAKQNNLPVGPVLDRIEQGLSKGVPPERIAAASGQLVEKLAAAKPLVDALTQGGVKSGPGAERDAAIASAARALEKSIPAEDVKEMGLAVRAKGAGLPLFTSAVDAATYFTGRGMSSKTASQLVRHAVEKGYTQKDLDGMARQLDAEMRRGTKPDDAAAIMERGGMQGERGMDRQGMQSDHGGGAGTGMGGRGGHGR
jgi:hypothetical protein